MKFSKEHKKFFFFFTRQQMDFLTNLEENKRGYLIFDVVSSDKMEKLNKEILFFLKENRIAGNAKDILDSYLKDGYWGEDFLAIVTCQSLEDDTQSAIMPFLKLEKKWDASSYGKNYLQNLKQIEEKADVDLYRNIYVISENIHHIIYRCGDYGLVIDREIVPLIHEEMQDFENRLNFFHEYGYFPYED